MKQLILASSSPYRRQLLEQLNIPFEQYSPDVDEHAIQASNLPVHAKAEQLAVLKAEAVLAKFPQAVVIGGDQIAALGETVLLKPGNAENAINQLKSLSGNTHCLYTSIAVISAHSRDVFTDIAKLTMHPHSEAQLQAYVATDTPYDCAGSYKFEQQGYRLFSAVECDDETAIQGIPLQRLAKVLASMGLVT